MSLFQVDKIFQYIKLTLYMKKLSLLDAMSYKWSFISQMVGIWINDGLLLFIWQLFFQQFPNINGWTFDDTITMICATWFGYELAMFIGYGVYDLSASIMTGEIDYFLVYPKNTLWAIAVHKTSIQDFGSMLLILNILIFYKHASLLWILKFILVSCLSGSIFFSFMLIINSLAFFIGNSSEFCQNLISLIFSLTYFPEIIFPRNFRFIINLVLPIFFIATLPVITIKDFSLINIGLLTFTTIIFAIISINFFYFGLKRYESGNLINVKV